MSLTSTGPSGFHIKPVVTVLAAVAFVAAVYAISQQLWTDSQPSASAPAGVSTEAAEPYAGTSNRLIEGIDDGPFVEPSETFPATEPATEIVVIEGEGSNFDALIAGKYDADFPGVPDVQYVLVPPSAADTSNQLIEGSGDGPSVEPSPSAGTPSHTPTVSGGLQE
jgi:hypothetical protein